MYIYCICSVRLSCYNGQQRGSDRIRRILVHPCTQSKRHLCTRHHPSAPLSGCQAWACLSSPRLDQPEFTRWLFCRVGASGVGGNGAAFWRFEWERWQNPSSTAELSIGPGSHLVSCIDAGQGSSLEMSMPNQKGRMQLGMWTTHQEATMPTKT